MFLRTLPLVGLLFVSTALLTATAPAQQVSKRPAWNASRIKGQPTPPEPYSVKPAFPGVRFTKPTSLEEMPGGKRLLVTEMAGRILTIRKADDVDQADLALDLKSMLPKEQAEKRVSLFSAVLHPKFAENRTLLVCYVHPAGGGHTRVSRLRMKNTDPPVVDASSEQVLIRWPSGGHNGGCMRFGTDGYLYISTGDGFGPNPPDKRNTGQDVSDLLGSVLRIDIDRHDNGKPYAIPSDNPFVDLDGARAEIWAYGLRNPWKFGIDRQSGEIYVADNGWESWEMVHRIQRGGNCGWPIMEGRALLRAEVKRGPTPIIPPVKDHAHTEANSVIGGPVYRGEFFKDLNGSFVYGDYITGTIWALRSDGGNNFSHRTLVDTNLRIVDFAEGGEGELYVLDYDFDGRIYQLVPSGLKDTSADFPRRLSETGLFKSLENLQPEAGVIPYRVRAPRWLDGARSQRFIAIPGVASTSLSDHQGAAYPAGTVLVKHLWFGRPGAKPIPVETQILHYEQDQWRPYSYLWDKDGKDALLVDSIGADRALRIPNPVAPERPRERTWHVGAQNECKLCHNVGSNFVLGFNAPQLDFPKRPAGQLDWLAAKGVIDSVPKMADNDPRRLVNPHDVEQPLDDRARSYLHVNCASCHHPRGNAIVSFYLRRDMPFDQLNTNKRTGIGTFGMRDAKLLTPGDPYRSVISYRMSKLGYARMPYIGSRVVDSRGVALVMNWIRSLERDRANPPSALVTKGTVDAEALERVRQNGDDEQQRDAAIRQLLQTTEGSLALIEQMHAKTIEPKLIRRVVAFGAKSGGDIAGLFDHFLPESRRRARLGPNIQPQTVLKVEGDAGRGRLIFFSDSARCRNCHQLDQAKESVGPTLTEIANKYPRRGELLQHVLQPSLKIEEKFATYAIVTNTGRVHTGLLLEKTDKAVVLKSAEKRIIRILVTDIDELRKSDRSLMPEKILSDLTAQQAADLIAFLLSLRTGDKATD